MDIHITYIQHVQYEPFVCFYIVKDDWFYQNPPVYSMFDWLKLALDTHLAF